MLHDQLGTDDPRAPGGERDPDNDRHYRNPRAWFKAKAALGGVVARVMEAFQRVAGNVRDDAPTALAMWMAATPDERATAAAGKWLIHALTYPDATRRGADGSRSVDTVDVGGCRYNVRLAGEPGPDPEAFRVDHARGTITLDPALPPDEAPRLLRRALGAARDRRAGDAVATIAVAGRSMQVRVVRGPHFARGDGWHGADGTAVNPRRAYRASTFIDLAGGTFTLSDRATDEQVGRAFLLALCGLARGRVTTTNAAADVPADEPPGYEADADGVYHCPHCRRRYKRAGMFGRHVRRVHKVEPNTGGPAMPKWSDPDGLG